MWKWHSKRETPGWTFNEMRDAREWPREREWEISPFFLMRTLRWHTAWHTQESLRSTVEQCAADEKYVMRNFTQYVRLLFGPYCGIRDHFNQLLVASYAICAQPTGMTCAQWCAVFFSISAHQPIIINSKQQIFVISYWSWCCIGRCTMFSWAPDARCCVRESISTRNIVCATFWCMSTCSPLLPSTFCHSKHRLHAPHNPNQKHFQNGFSLNWAVVSIGPVSEQIYYLLWDIQAWCVPYRFFLFIVKCPVFELVFLPLHRM